MKRSQFFILILLSCLALSASAQTSDAETKDSKGGILNIFKNKKKKLEAENKGLKNESEALKNESAVLELRLDRERQDKLRLKERLKFEETNQELLHESLEKQAEVLESLTEAQAKTNLMLAKQQLLADSLRFASEVARLRLNEQDMQLGKQQAQLEASQAKAAMHKSQKILFAVLGLCGFLAVLALYNRIRNVRKYSKQLESKNDEIKTQKQRTEALLYNILPIYIADELQATGTVVARELPDVTVLFTDFVNFTRISELLSPQALVEDLDYCFTGFDRIIDRYGLEKIKTIGDAYMVAGGLSGKPVESAIKMIHAAQEMQTFLAVWNAKRKAGSLPEFHARIGIHTGDVVAGVVGERKFAFDIWGDTVNVAARMESASAPDSINVSEHTQKLTSNQFIFDPRGHIDTKHKGEMKMFYVG